MLQSSFGERSGMSGVGVKNTGEPLRFESIEPLAGFAVEPAKPGQNTKVCCRIALTSDDPLFHKLVESLDDFIQYMAQTAGAIVDIRRAEAVMLIFRPNKSAELWVDAAAVAMQIIAKRPVNAGALIYDSDVADVLGMSFPHVPINENDRVLYLFREGWSFGMAFDFNSHGNFDQVWFSSVLGKLYRTLHYRHLYKAIEDPAIFDPLISAGWFPFVEIIGSEFRELSSYAESGFEASEIESKIIAAFNAERLNHIFSRWKAKPHFASRTTLLQEAIDAFIAAKPASTIKIILTEIEGVLNEAHKAAYGGKGAKLGRLLSFAQASAEQRTGAPDTLLFPAAFGRYLAVHTFANFDPVAQTGTAASRHAVGHGAAAQDTYTMTRALQAILTLDQLAFYT
jgi:hypothetical protein